MAKKIGSTESDVLITGAIVVGAIFGIKYLLAGFGASPEETAAVQNQSTTSPNANPFNPSFQPLLDQWNANQPAGLSISDGMKQLYQLFQNGQATGQGLTIATWADTLKNALSVWNLLADDNAVFSVFNQMTSQTQCANLAAYVTYNFNKDLLQWLHYGGSPIPWIPNGLSISQVAIIVNEVNSLPVS